MNHFFYRIIAISILSTFASFLNGQTLSVDSLNQLAYKTYRQDVAKSKSYAFKALSLSRQKLDEKGEVDAYVNLGRCYRLESEWDSAFHLLRKALTISTESQYSEGLLHANNNLGAIHLMRSDPESAKPFIDESLTLALQINDIKAQANAYNNLAIIAQYQEQYPEAIQFLEQAIKAYQNVSDSIGLARSFANQASLYDLSEENEKAIQQYFSALKIQEGLGLAYQKSLTLINIGDLYIEKGKQVEALAQYQKGLALSKKIGNLTGLAIASQNIGSTLDALGQAPEAILYLDSALVYARKTEDPELIGSCLVDLGTYYRDKNEIEKASAFLEEATDYLEEIYSPKLGELYDGLGAIAYLQKDWSQALAWYQGELEVAVDFGDLENQRYALLAISDIYRILDRPRLALQYVDQYHDIKDSIVNEHSLETINQLNIEYETEKKEKENLRLENELTNAALVASERKAQRNLIIGIASILMLLVFGGFVWYRYRQRIVLKEKSIELEQERARQEQQRKEAEKLQELDAMKTRFFTNISHEFRTPLTLILGQNEQLQRAVPDPELQNRFQMVDRNGHRLLDLINQVLDVAKLEAGGMQLEPASLNAIPFLKHMLYSFESLAMEQEIRLVFKSDTKQLTTAFDLKKMERILFNLLSNAIKFSKPDSEISMIVKARPEQMIIGVRDTGVGIKSEQLPNIFDRFYQADSSEQQPQPGTGIGLSLVKELVELHDGSIRVESELGIGTTFWLHLPIPADLSIFPSASGERSAQLNPAALPVKDLGKAAAGSNESKTQILIIEDNPDIRSYVRDQLLSFGYQVLEAEDGKAGLTKAKEHLPDLIISDIMMPNLDGYGVAKGLRTDQKTSHIPLILLTSKASDESKIKGFELGIDDYLLKPFNTDELRVRVANLIKQRQRLRERFTSAMIIRPKEVSTVPLDQQFLQKVLNLIEDNLSNEQFSVELLSEKIGMSITHLNRKLRALVDQPAGKLIRSMRLQRAADLLRQQSTTISDIAYELGFSNPTHFARAFKKQFGISPSEYAKNPA